MKTTFVILALFAISPSLLAQNNAAQDYVSFYQKYISAVKTSYCPMYPTCSVYGRLCFQNYKFPKAFSLACDRLLRCSHDAEFYHNSFNYGLLDFPDDKLMSDTIRFADFPEPKVAVLKRLPSRNDTTLFINYLINSENYQAALLEIERQVYFKGLNSELFKQKLVCYEAQRRFDKAITEFEMLRDSSIKQSADVRLHAAKIYDYAGITDSALTVLYQTSKFDNDDLRLKIKTYCAVLEAKRDNYDASRQEFEKLRPMSSKTDDNIRLVDNIANLKYKKPGLAAGLSVIPGLGYIYTKHVGSGFISFLINTLLGYSVYTSIKSKNYGVAGLVGFVGLGFYTGNIQGAAGSAHRYNKALKKKALDKLYDYNQLFFY
jgi:putative component of membrane protein insertase Oxa1/YidC/SpoIIIJ protein YidD